MDRGEKKESEKTEKEEKVKFKVIRVIVSKKLQFE